MTQEAFIAFCLNHGWSYHRVARILGVGKDTPSRWAAGTVKLNPAAGRFLEIIEHVPEAMRYVVEQGWIGQSVGRPKKKTKQE